MITHVRHVVRSIDKLESMWPSDVRIWLSPAEQEQLAGWRNTERRRQWLAGRWLSKRFVRELDGDSPPYSEIEIHSRDGFHRAVRTQLFVEGRMLKWSISVTHSAGLVGVAVSAKSNLQVGIDITPISGRSLSGLRMWLTERERHWLNTAQDDSLISAVWSVKEAVYKAANKGEPFKPLQIEVAWDSLSKFRCTGPSSHGPCLIHVRRFPDHIETIAVARRCCSSALERTWQRTPASRVRHKSHDRASTSGTVNHD